MPDLLIGLVMIIAAVAVGVFLGRQIRPANQPDPRLVDIHESTTAILAELLDNRRALKALTNGVLDRERDRPCRFGTLLDETDLHISTHTALSSKEPAA